MREVQGLFIIGAGVFLLWVAVTGRFENLIQGLGMVRSGPNPAPSSSIPGVTNLYGTGIPLTVTPGMGYGVYK